MNPNPQFPHLIAGLRNAREVVMKRILVRIPEAGNEVVQEKLIELRGIYGRLQHLEKVLSKPGVTPEHVGHEARLMACCLLATVSLPRDLDKLGAVLEELAWLGFDLPQLTVRSVFEEPITGEDFQ